MTIETRQAIHAAFWRPLTWLGMEQLFIKYYDDEEDAGYIADGMVLALRDGEPSRTQYHLSLSSNWRFEGLRLHHWSGIPIPEDSFSGPDSRELWIDNDGNWRHRGFEQAPDLSDCIDIDITVTPFTNTLPIRRLQLEEGQSAEISVAWIHIPELTLENARQRYTLLERTGTGARYRFEGLFSRFQADLDVDADGLVIDYPGLWERVS
jgi:hypothetical protein